MVLKFSVRVVSGLATPILACCVSAHAPTAIHIRILPHQNDVMGVRFDIMAKTPPADFRVQSVIKSVEVVQSGACSPNQHYPSDHYDAHDGVIQYCQNLIRAVVSGKYQLREGVTNRLVYESVVKGMFEVTQHVTRLLGDFDLIPLDKRQLTDSTILPTQGDAILLALYDFNIRLEESVQLSFSDSTSVLMFEYD